MKRKQKVVVELHVKDNKKFAYIRNKKQFVDINKLNYFLDSCREDKIIENGIKVRNHNYTNYNYDIRLEEGKVYSFEVKVKNSEKSLYGDTIKYMETLCELGATIKKVNRVRLIAGLAVGTLILVSTGPTIIEHYNNSNQKRLEHERQETEERNRRENEIPYYPTEEEKQKAEEAYYEALKERAENGDEEAAKEYQEYLIDKMLLEQQEETAKSR